MNMQTFEELRRHQLVTGFDVQSQSELDDYQVKLENVDNPTQAHDNLVVSNNGEPLPHWNESVDFDTWVKMNIEASGKRGLLIHGNAGLSGGSSISDTMIIGDDFSTDLTGFTVAGDSGSAVVTGGELQIDGYADYNPRVYSDITVGVNTIAEFRAKKVADTWFDVGFTDLTDNSAIATNGNSIYIQPYPDTNTTILVDNVSSGTRSYTEVGSQTVGSVYRKYKIIRNGSTNAKFYFEGSLINTKSTQLPLGDLSLFVEAYAAASEVHLDYMFVRKYTATEPTVHTSTPKNISTALKSFGRAG